MGSTPSRPQRFGDGDSGTCVGVGVDRTGLTRKALLCVGRNFLDEYNPSTGDRRVRVPLEDEALSAAFAQDTIAGGIALVGTAEGNVRIFDSATLAEAKCLETGVGENGVSVVGCFTYEDGFAGHSDGRVVAFPLLGGGVSEEFGAGDGERGERGGVVGLFGRGGSSEGRCEEVVVVYESGWVVRFAAKGKEQGKEIKALKTDVSAIGGGIKQAAYTRAHDTLWLAVSNTTKLIAVTFPRHTDGGEGDGSEGGGGGETRVSVVDPGDEVRRLSGGSEEATKTTCITIDALGGMLFTAIKDCSVFARVVTTAPDGRIGLRSHSHFSPTTSSSASAPPTALTYDERSDALLIGLADGRVKIIRRSTGREREERIGKEGEGEGKEEREGEGE